MGTLAHHLDVTLIIKAHNYKKHKKLFLYKSAFFLGIKRKLQKAQLLSL